jgi:hypothetical protein
MTQQESDLPIDRFCCINLSGVTGVRLSFARPFTQPLKTGG